jgi:hypothetical protein
MRLCALVAEVVTTCRLIAAPKRQGSIRGVGAVAGLVLGVFSAPFSAVVLANFLPVLANARSKQVQVRRDLELMLVFAFVFQRLQSRSSHAH